MLKNKTNYIHLGDVLVDSGQLEITDPRIQSDNNEEGNVQFNTGVGDGLFPVFAIEENGLRTGIFIELNPEGAPI